MLVLGSFVRCWWLMLDHGKSLCSVREKRVVKMECPSCIQETRESERCLRTSFYLGDRRDPLFMP